MTTLQKVGLAILGATVVCILVFFGHFSQNRLGAINPVGQTQTNTVWYTNGLYGGGSQQWGIDSNGNETIAGNIIQTLRSDLAIFPGTVIANNVIQASGGYAQTLTTNSTVTVPQWCAGTAILVPVTTAGSITITLPAASSTYAACGGVAGGWSQQIIDNESSFAVTLATTTGGANIQFMMATGTTQTAYPPTIPASTTEMFIGQYTSSTGLNAYLQNFYRQYKTGT